MASPPTHSSNTPTNSQSKTELQSEDPSIEPLLSELLSQTPHPWRLTASGVGIERGYRFKTFKKAWDFMSAVAQECKKARHHPEWSNVYNTVFIRWTTHAPSPAHLSPKDVSMARFCDERGKEFDEVEPSPEEIKASQANESGKGYEEGTKGDGDLLDSVVCAGGGEGACCLPPGESPSHK